MQKIEQKSGGLKRRVRNRTRSVTKKVIAIAHALRHKGPAGEEKRQAEYGHLIRTTRQILNDAKRVLEEVDILSRGRKTKVRKLREQLQTMAERVRRVVRQTKGRIFGGLASAKNHAEPLLPPARRRLSTQVLRARKNRTGNA